MRRYNSLDSPLLRVSRPVAACSRCRAAKIKCDGKLPACTACEKTGRESECSSSNDQFAKGKERSYVASLESRVEKLEKRLAFARSRKASIAMHDGEAQPDEKSDRKDSLATIRAAIHGKAARRREATDVNELVSDFGFLSVNATARDFETATTHMTFARLILAASINEPIKSKNQELPSRPVATALVQYYLDNVFALFPAFPETALFNALDAVYQVPGRTMAAFEYWLLYIVFGIAAMAQSRSKKDIRYREGLGWVSKALPYADEVLVPGHVSTIQALILLVQYSMLDPAHFDSWHLIGFACRALVDIGFHCDPPKVQQLEKKSLESRRRLFYSVYALDRSISMVHARSFSFTDDSTSVAFPSVSSTSSGGRGSSLPGASSLDTALLLFQLRRAQSTWYQELFQAGRKPLKHSSTYIWQMCQDMRVWSETFPESLSSSTRELFELELLYSYVYCLAPSARVPEVSEIGKTLIFEYSMAYVEKILPISKDVKNTAFYSYHDSLRVYFIGSQFMAVLSANLDQILNFALQYSSVIVGGPPPPPILKESAGRTDNIDRSISCIEHITEILKKYGERWSDSEILQASFEGQAAGLLSELYRRKQQQNGFSRNGRSSENDLGSRLSPDHVESRLSSDWARMGQIVARGTILQGGIQPPGEH